MRSAGSRSSQAAISTAYGPSTWPWGAAPDVTDEVAKIANYNPGTGGFGATKNPRYLWPVVNYATFANDFSPIIAAPGRFPMDASQVLPPADTWMDLGGNMIEWSQAGGVWYGWTGSSFEGRRSKPHEQRDSCSHAECATRRRPLFARRTAPARSAAHHAGFSSPHARATH